MLRISIDVVDVDLVSRIRHICLRIGNFGGIDLEEGPHSVS